VPATAVSEGIVLPLLRDLGPCPVCVGASLRPLDVYTNGARAVTNAIRLALVGCESCGVVFSHPLPSREELDRYYGAGYRLESKVPPAREKLERLLERKRANNSRHLFALGQLIDVRPRVRQLRAFDFGCGLGAWLDVLQLQGWQTFGYEPGPYARSIAARRHTMLDEIPAEPQFDLVIVNHVLEHLRDPLGVVRGLAEATRQDGNIYVSVPDLSRLAEHRSFGYVRNERHIVSFTPSALHSLLALAGFELLAHSNQPTWPGEPVNKDDAKRLKAVGQRVSGELSLPSRPLEEAIEALLRFEPHFARRILGENGQAPRQPAKPPAAQSRRSRPRLRPAIKRARHLLLVRTLAVAKAGLRRVVARAG
jgi:SAM-dependent methyltransferase